MTGECLPFLFFICSLNNVFILHKIVHLKEPVAKAANKTLIQGLHPFAAAAPYAFKYS